MNLKNLSGVQASGGLLLGCSQREPFRPVLMKFENLFR